MARACPLCPSQRMKPIQARDVVVECCPRCQGLWFDPGTLELFPDRPSARTFVAAARTAPSRCRRGAHVVPRSLAACATCKGPPLGCPGCGERLSLVTTPRCAVDVCAACEGIWLDAGELELLERRPAEAPAPTRPTAVSSRWEIPQPTDDGGDPWRSPGAARALPHSSRQPFARGTSLTCEHCAATLTARTAWVSSGDVYCAGCRPEGAISGASLPADDLFLGKTAGPPALGARLHAIVRALFGLVP